MMPFSYLTLCCVQYEKPKQSSCPTWISFLNIQMRITILAKNRLMLSQTKDSSLNTVHAIAVNEDTRTCPLNIRSLQPPPALLRVVNQDSCPVATSGSCGLKKLTRNCVLPQSGMYSAGNCPTGAAVKPT